MANIFVSNIPYDVTKEEIHELFRPYGRIKFLKIVTDSGSGRSKGFGFVDMDSDAAGKAIAALNDFELGGRRLQVNEARKPFFRPFK